MQIKLFGVLNCLLLVTETNNSTNGEDIAYK